MIGFKTELTVNLYDSFDNLWILAAPLIYQSKKHGLVTVPAGFVTDFASVPRLPIIHSAWGDRAHRESVLHDYLYRIDAVPKLSFMECNNLFLEAMESRGVAFFIRYPMYLGVCACGRFFFKTNCVTDYE